MVGGQPRVGVRPTVRAVEGVQHGESTAPVQLIHGSAPDSPARIRDNQIAAAVSAGVAAERCRAIDIARLVHKQVPIHAIPVRYLESVEDGLLAGSWVHSEQHSAAGTGLPGQAPVRSPPAMAVP